MEKIVGRIVFAFVCSVSSAYAGISLRVVDVQGVPLKQAVIGEQFNIQVVTSGQMNDFQLDGIDRIKIIGKNTISHSVNNNVTYKYVFLARCDELGSYTIGPATATINGTVERSDVAQLDVVAEPPAAKNEVSTAFLRLNTDKKRVVIGEEIKGTVRFYCCKDDLTLDQISKSDLTEFEVDAFTEPQYGKEMVNGLEYNYIEVTWTMAAKKAGSITIPAWSAHYSVPLLDSTFGPFRFMQSLQRQQKRVYSNALQIEVVPLPQFGGKLHGVGTFEDMNIHASSQVTKEGEANVIRIDIIGEGTLTGYEPVQLTGVPEGLKSYESKQYTDVCQNGLKKTSYEYIVQGLKAGDWEIPAQCFTYFDVARKEYVTHKTMPLIITVLSQPGLKTVVATNIASDTQEVESGDTVDGANGMRLSTHGVWYAQQYREIPSQLFLIFLALPLTVFGFGGMRSWYATRQERREPMMRKKYAHARAYKAVCDAEKRKAYHELYPIFVEYFASRTESSIPECSDDAIIVLLREKGLSQDDIAAWQRFFTDIMRLAYAGSGQQSKLSHDIIRRSYEWLERLKGVL
jgi:hypothetical protein